MGYIRDAISFCFRVIVDGLAADGKRRRAKLLEEIEQWERQHKGSEVPVRPNVRIEWSRRRKEER